MGARTYSDADIFAVIQAGADLDAVRRALGVSEATSYRWRAKYAGLDRDGIQRVRELERENALLKRRIALFWAAGDTPISDSDSAISDMDDMLGSK